MPSRFKKVNDSVYRGGAPSERDLDLLSNKINRVISLDENVASYISPHVKDLGMEHVVIPLNGGETKNTYFTDLLKKRIVPLLLDNAPTYIHCLHGSDRTGLAIALFRAQFDKWEPEDAIEEAITFQFGDKISDSTASFYCDLVGGSSGEDVNDIQGVDTAAQMYEMFGLQDIPPYFSPRQSWAPFTDIYHHNPWYPVEDKGRDRKVRKQEFRRQILNQILQKYNDNSVHNVVPFVGAYDNYAGVRGVGPVSTGGWMQF